MMVLADNRHPVRKLAPGLIGAEEIITVSSLAGIPNGFIANKGWIDLETILLMGRQTHGA